MRKAVVIFFLGLYVFSATEAGELLRLPLLIQHFITHQQEDQSMTFFKFLSLHYEDTGSEDYKDNSLPFKSPDHSAFIAHVFAIPPSSGLGLVIPCTYHELPPIRFQEHFLKSAYLAFIWQPPKSF